MQDLTITAIQPILHWGNRERNLAMFNEYLRDAAPADLFLLPEMFNTGFMVEPEPVAEAMDGPTIRWMHDVASSRSMVVAGSLIIREDGKYYNRLVWMRPDGTLDHYDKHHLFTMGGEHERFTRGNERPDIEFKGWRVRPVICYDLRFPVWCKNTYRDGKYGYDLLICVASWPEVRSVAWKHFLGARAVENQSFVAGVNRVGVDGRGVDHSGDSAVFDPQGRVVEAFKAKIPAMKTIVLKARVLEAYRRAFRVGPDWDPFDFS